jgi:hypothetical protein
MGKIDTVLANFDTPLHFNVVDKNHYVPCPLILLTICILICN